MSTPPFKVKAIYEYKSPEEDDLQFENGQIITVTENDEEDWYTGEYIDDEGTKQEGIFPRNFVEKYEPPAPPRPTRPAKAKKEDAPVAAEPAEEVPTSSVPSQAAQEPQAQRPAPSAADQSPPQTRAVPAGTATSQTSAQAPPNATSTSKAVPPPVSEKPSGGSFKDRIAAFNKGSSGPAPVPFKPSGLGGTGGFIKKPFVAPPPSKNAYVPVPKQEQAPQKIYRREEDPEIAAQEAESQEAAERAGLAPTGVEGEDDDQPKPTSLKDRIALLQKQQMEQAARHADAAAKKEKPKKPAKKTQDASAQDMEDATSLEKLDSQDTVGRRSMDSVNAEPVARAPIPRRRSSRGPPAIPGSIRESDGNDADMSGAGDETEETEELSAGREDLDDKPRSRAPPPPARAPAAPSREPDVGEEEGPASEEEPLQQSDIEADEEEEEEEEDIDPEVRRKEELRARMAKMSGGMGMHGMFGPPGGMAMPMPGVGAPVKKKASSGSSQRQSNDTEASASLSRAPPVPMPGLSRVKSPEDLAEVENEEDADQTPMLQSRNPLEVPDVEDLKPAPPVPGGRPLPPPVPTESRPAPPQIPMSPGDGSEADDDSSIKTPKLSLQTAAPLPDRTLPPRLGASGAPAVPMRASDGPLSPKSPSAKRASYFSSSVDSTPGSPITPGVTKRQSRVPPIPGAAVVTPVAPPTQSRAPPPPPPGAPSLSRSSTGDAYPLPPTHANQDESEEEVTEYEGDYDTDIAPTAPHKEALKAHARDSSLDDLDSSAQSPPMSPVIAPPRAPPAAAPRAVPPPPPGHQTRQSVDAPRVAPPPLPPTHAVQDDNDEYDPYKYTAPIASPPIPSISRMQTAGSEDIYAASPPRAQPMPPQERAAPLPPQERAAPPPPPREYIVPTQAPAAMTRQSMEAPRMSSNARRSTDLNRMPMDTGAVAADIDMAESTNWWTIPNGVPPALQNRKDILYEMEESTATKRGGKTTVTKDIYVLFQDYSQTVITVNFDAQNPVDARFEQRHEQPPARLRQDQLESAWETFGRKLGESAATKKDSVVGDGTPAGLVNELLKPFTEALLPVGTRAYGALVYANLANASVAQHDEIRPGDIITLRNAKLQGKHGPMHAKYSVEVGAGVGHVAIVAEWDGTKKKVRAWEQGRESKKVKLESFKLDDLRSGEVKIWRIMPRSWVGWEGSN